MKNVIYSKKIFIALFVFLILFNFLFPNMVRASVTWSANNATGSIQEVADSMRTLTSNSANGSSKKTIADMVGSPKETDKLEEAVINEIKNKFSGLESSLHKKAYNYYRNDQESIEVTCNIGGTSVNGYFISGFTVKFGSGLTEDKIKTDLEGKSDSEIGEVDTGTQTDTSSNSSATGQNPNGGPIVEQEDDESDIGGILLSPVFALINFIVDAITSSLGGIMTGDGLSLGVDILTTELPSTDGQDLSDAYTVNVESFGTYQYPNIKYTPEEIFSGKIDMLSVDFISGKNSEGQEITGDWASIRSVIASWYKVLRMIAIVGLLSVLIYTGIKIIISANAKDKAKYKEWIINWLMAVAILFSMHYVMAFINAVIGELSGLLQETCGKIIVKVEGGSGELFATNLMGLVRFMIQSEKFMIKVGYEVMYIALLVYTIKFTVIYLKRVLSMAFLTLIAPIVALTYPIDKLNDGNAQGFNMWIKEYIFNALLQPMHLIMYYILLGSAVSIAAKNPIYGIVVLAFMTEAEKLLKKIFGFNKAGVETVGGMAGAFAAGALASSVKDIARMAKLGGGNGNKGANSGLPKNEALDAPKPTEKPGFDEAFSDEGGPEAGAGNDDASEDGSAEDAALEAYRNDGYGQNANGHYFNPNTDEYDEDYNPATDPLYEQRQTSGNESESSNSSSSQTSETTSTPETNSTSGSSEDNGESIRDKARRLGRGAKSVGKRLAKPIWDFDRSGKYNGRRLARNVAKGIAKGVGGFALGTAAAAVQAGISITDGKYNPMEGMATFAAGFAGASGVVDKVDSGIGSLIDTYNEGAYAGDKKKQMERAQDRFADRDDVIAFNKKEYAGKEKEYMQRERDHYLPSGVSDLKDMKRCMKYADSMVGKTDNMTAEQIKVAREKADRKAAATLDFKKRLQDQGQLAAVYDKDKQDKYIKQMVAEAQRNGQDAAKTEKQYRNAFKSIVAFDAANA